ncbi:MAG: histidine kinase [Firmicutes bacterium]|nr:histidine kinase [Bacillota bacterium]
METILRQLFPMILQLVGLAFAVIRDPYIQRTYRLLLLIIVYIVASLLLQNIGTFLGEVYRLHRAWRIAIAVYGYSVRPLILVMFMQVVGINKHPYLPWGLVVFNALMYATAFFSSITFTYNENGNFIRGPLGYLCHIISTLLLFWLVLDSSKNYWNERRHEALIPIFCSLIILISVILDSVLYDREIISFLTVAVVNACVFFYIWLHLQFVREHEQALKAEQRIQIMMTQIQPHFLYNTLSTIQALCRIDPEKASLMTERFGTYLRQNINFLDQPNLISIEKELEHTKVYTEIEMVRFPHIRMDYQIDDKDFQIPALTIQPLVENAIRHGVRGMKDGQIRVSTSYGEHVHKIVIQDNGSGFDPAGVKKAQGTHIGLRNVRERLDSMVKGSMVIESAPGQGTAITILIPDPAGKPLSAGKQV